MTTFRRREESWGHTHRWHDSYLPLPALVVGQAVAGSFAGVREDVGDVPNLARTGFVRVRAVRVAAVVGRDVAASPGLTAGAAVLEAAPVAGVAELAGDAEKVLVAVLARAAVAVEGAAGDLAVVAEPVADFVVGDTG